MKKTEKKQFSMGLTFRILIGVVVLIAVGVFLRGIMRYNQLKKEAEYLEQNLSEFYEIRAELIDLLGSGEELKKLLADYEECREVLNSGTATGEALHEYQSKMEEIRAWLNDPKNKDYISGIAKDQLGLYYADEEIFYNNMQ